MQIKLLQLDKSSSCHRKEKKSPNYFSENRLNESQTFALGCGRRELKFNSNYNTKLKSAYGGDGLLNEGDLCSDLR